MRVSLILVTLGILATVVSGAIFMKKAKKVSKSGMRKAVITNVLAFADSAANTATNSASGLGYLAAALSTGLAAIGAGIGVGQAGSAAIGAISEDSSILGKTLIILGLAEGVAIYGLVISIMIIQRL